MRVSANDTVDEVMRGWPDTIRVFLDRNTLCIGCPLARFCTVEDACSAYGLGVEDFVAELTAHAEADCRVR